LLGSWPRNCKGFAMNDEQIESPTEQRETAPPLPPGWLSQHPWATFLLPFIVYMAVGSLEPAPPKATEALEANAAATAGDAADASLVETVVDADALEGQLEKQLEEQVDDESGWIPEIPYRFYPVVYTVKILLTCVAMALVWPGYRTFPFSVSPLAFTVGVVGVVLWVGICKLGVEERLFGPQGFGGMIQRLVSSTGVQSDEVVGQRSAFNPLKQLADDPAAAYGFLAIRLFGLAVVVPIIEEFFLRGFLMRFVIHDNWHQIPFGTVNKLAVIVGTGVPMLMHPAELFAALVWFSMVTWLMVRTRNIWDCVVAHAVTNLLLGVYVIASGDWQLM